MAISYHNDASLLRGIDVQQQKRVTRKLASAEEIVKAVCALLADKKAEEIVTINLVGKSAIADYMVVATGQSGRQIVAMTDYVVATLKAMGITAHIEGLPYADWVLIDGGNVIVHLFRPEVRLFYNLEKMWSELNMDAPTD